jgi:tetratricopeptide (TPR) repeat protein
MLKRSVRNSLRQRLGLIIPLGLFLALGALLRSEDGAADIRRFELLIEGQKYASASVELEAYVQQHPDSWRALYQLGYVYFRLHRIQESSNLLATSQALNDNFAESHKILAFDLNILGRPDLAEKELQQAIRLDPASYESHYELGRIYFERSSYVSAIAELETAKQLAPDFVKVYHNLGLAYSGVGDNGRAIENFKKGLELNTRQSKPSAWPLIDFGTYYNLQNEFAKARDLLLEAVQIDSRWDQAYGELGKAFRGLGQTAEAIDALKQAVVLNPRKAEYHYMLARLYTQTHQLAEAKEQLSEFEHQRSPETK